MKAHPEGMAPGNAAFIVIISTVTATERNSLAQGKLRGRSSAIYFPDSFTYAMLSPGIKYPLRASVSEKGSFWFCNSSITFGLLCYYAYPFVHQEEGEKNTLECDVMLKGIYQAEDICHKHTSTQITKALFPCNHLSCLVRCTET